MIRSGLPVVRFLLLLFLAAAAYADGSDKPNSHMLWRVATADTTLYLLGSVHALRPQDYPLAEAYEDAYREADRVILEINPALDTPQAIHRLSTEMGQIPEGDNLQSYMSGKGYRRAMELADELGFNTAVLNRLEPWLAALTVVSRQMLQAGFQLMIGVDNYFAQRALADSKNLGGLETADYQISLFDGLSPQVQEDFLLQSLEGAASFKRDMTEMVELWRAGNVEKLMEITRDDMQKYPEVHENLLLRRNRNWIAKLEREIKSGGTALVIVGSLHLVGKGGVIELLEQRGYEVERL